MTDFQSEQLDYDRNGDRTGDLEHSSTLTIPLCHRPSRKSIFATILYPEVNCKNSDLKMMKSFQKKIVDMKDLQK